MSDSPTRSLQAHPIWFINKEEAKLITRFESASFFYQRSTSETHLLTAFHDELIEYLLAHHSATTQGLSHHIAQICEEKYSEEWLIKTSKALTNLAMLDLIFTKDNK